MSFSMKFAGAFFWNYLNKITGFFLDFLLSIVLARGLGDYQYGIYSELFNIIFLFSIVCSLGLDTTINVYLPKYQDEPGITSYILRNTLLVVGFTSVLFSFVIYKFGPALSQIAHSPDLELLIKLASFYILLHNFLILAQTILISFYITKFLFLINGILKLVFVISAYVLLTNGAGIDGIIKIFTLFSFLASIAYIIRFYRLLLPGVKKINIIEFYQFGVVIWLTKFVNYVLGRYFDIFLLGYFAVSKNEIGYYNIAITLAMAMEYIFTSGFGGIILSACSEYEKRNELKQIAIGWQAITKFCIFFGIPAFTYTILYADFIILLLYSAVFYKVTLLFRMFAFFLLLTMIIGSGMNVTILYAMKKNNIVLTLRLIAGLVNIFLSIFLIPHYQVKGAIIATGFSTIFLVSLENLTIRRFIELKFPFKFLLKVVLVSTFSLGISSFLKVYSGPTLLLNGLLFIIIYLACSFLIKPLTVSDKNYISNIHPLFEKIIKFY